MKPEITYQDLLNISNDLDKKYKPNIPLKDWCTNKSLNKLIKRLNNESKNNNPVQ